jgi:hypothetical protein
MKAITGYWEKYYLTEETAEGIGSYRMCSLCSNNGIIDTRGTLSPRGNDLGRKNWCICPNGQALRKHAKGKLPE